MSSKEIKTIIIHKHDIEENWIKAVNFTPHKGEIVVYDADERHNSVRIKVGDGVSNINSLPFTVNHFNVKGVISGQYDFPHDGAVSDTDLVGRYLVSDQSFICSDGSGNFHIRVDGETYMDITSYSWTGETTDVIAEFPFGGTINGEHKDYFIFTADYFDASGSWTFTDRTPSPIVVDQTYSSTSKNAQSGIALADISNKANHAAKHSVDFVADDDGVHGIKFTPDYKVKMKDEHGVWTTVINLHKTNRYTAIIDEEESDPDLAVSYADDAKDMEAKSEEWLETDIFRDIRPCVFRDGEVQCYLDPNNYTQQIKNTEPLFYADEDIDLNKNMSFKQIIQSEAAYLYDENGESLPIGLENSNWNIGYGVQGGDQDRKQNITVCYCGKGYMEYIFDVPSAGEYYWLIRFNSQVSNAVRQLDFSINDGEYQTITFPKKGYVFQFMKQCVSLKSGINSIKVYTPADYWSDTSSGLTIEIDYMAITSIDIPDISSGIDKEVISPAYLLENNLTSVSRGLAPGFLKNNYSTGNQVLSFIVNDSASHESYHAITLGNTSNILMDKPISKYRYLRIYYECKKATEGIIAINAIVHLNNSEEVRRIWGNTRQITSNGNSGYIDIDLMRGWTGGEGLNQTTVNEKVNFDGPLVGLMLKPWYNQERKVDDYFNIQGLAFYTKDDYDDSVPSYFNGDVMVEIPKMGYRFNRVGTNLKVSVTREPEAVGFSYDAFLRGDKLNNYIYIGAYKACLSNNRLRSLSNQDCNLGENFMDMPTIRSLAEYNNTTNKGYSILTYSAYNLIACLSLLYNKSIKTTQGTPNIKDEMFKTSGTTNTNGLIYDSSGSSTGYKFIGIENIVNNNCNYDDFQHYGSNAILEGLKFSDDATNDIYMATKDFSNPESWIKVSKYGNISDEDAYFVAYFKAVKGDNIFGFLGDKIGASESTYYCYDGIYTNGDNAWGGYFVAPASNCGLCCISLLSYYSTNACVSGYEHNLHLMYSAE